MLGDEKTLLACTPYSLKSWFKLSSWYQYHLASCTSTNLSIRITFLDYRHGEIKTESYLLQEFVAFNEIQSPLWQARRQNFGHSPVKQYGNYRSTRYLSIVAEESKQNVVAALFTCELKLELWSNSLAGGIKEPQNSAVQQRIPSRK